MGDSGVSESEIITTFKQMKAEQNAIVSKISELELDANEHSLVINAIEKLEPSRKCFRLVGGVLVERTVEEVLPAVKRNKEGLTDAVDKLNAQLTQKSKDINDFVAKHKIQFKSQNELLAADRKEEKSSSSGVLV